jgi:rubredoxin
MKCVEQHTVWQPSEEEFRCPVCGAESGDFFIEESVAEEDPASGTLVCDLLHRDDFLYCDSCGFSCRGEEFVERVNTKVGTLEFIEKVWEIAEAKGWRDVPGVYEALAAHYMSDVLKELD